MVCVHTHVYVHVHCMYFVKLVCTEKLDSCSMRSEEICCHCQTCMTSFCSPSFQNSFLIQGLETVCTVSVCIIKFLVAVREVKLCRDRKVDNLFQCCGTWELPGSSVLQFDMKCETFMWKRMS